MSKILCIDIGGTRIKAAILKDNISLDELQNTKVEVIRSLGWLNSSLPGILSRSHPGSIFKQCNRLFDYDCISIAVPADVIHDGTEITGYYVEKRQVPRNLRSAFMQEAQCNVTIINDAVSWLTGALNYCKLSCVNIQFPCLIISLGTGVGIGSSMQPGVVENVELSRLRYNFSQLSQESKKIIEIGWKVHASLGEDFFYWLKNTCKDYTYQDIKTVYTDRVIALLLDMKAQGIKNFTDLKTIFIGGGNAEYVDPLIIKSKIKKEIFMLTVDNLKINPDLIPLIGQVKID